MASEVQFIILFAFIGSRVNGVKNSAIIWILFGRGSLTMKEKATAVSKNTKRK
jgi:hypothetical protein